MTDSPTSLELEPAPAARWRIVAMLVAFSFMSWFNRLSMAVAYDTSIRSEYGISEEAIGAVYSAFFISYLLLMTPGGWFIDRFGVKVALLVMGLGSGLFATMTGVVGLVAVMAATQLVAVLMVVRMCMGVFSAPIYPASSRTVASWVPLRQRAFCNGLVQGAAAAGMACAYPLFGAAVDLLDWPTAFVLSGGITMGLALLWLWHAADSPPGVPPAHFGPAQTHWSDWLSLLRDRSIVLLSISYGLIGYLEYLFFFWMNHYFDVVLKVKGSRMLTAILLVSMTFGMVLGGLLADWLRRRFGPWVGRALVPMAGMTLGAVFLVLGVISVELAWIVTWLALALFAVGACEAPVWTAAVELGGRHGGTAAALVNTGGNLGGIFAPILTPFVSHAIRDQFEVSEQVGWQWGIALAGVLCLSGAVLWWWIRPAKLEATN